MSAKKQKQKPEDLVEFDGDDESQFAPIHIWIFGPDGARPAIENVALRGNGAATNWRNIVATMSGYCESGDGEIAAKEDSLLAAFWRFKDPHGRCVRANAAAMTLLVLDYDGLMSYDEVRGSLDERGYAFFMHSTFSSAVYNTAPKKKLHECGFGKKGSDKFRVLIPLTREVATDEITDYLRKVVEENFPGIDRTCLSVARRFYLPSAPKLRKVRFDSNKGNPFDVNKALEEAGRRESQERIFFEKLKVDERGDDLGEQARTGSSLADGTENPEEWYCTVIDALQLFKDKGWYRSKKSDGWHYVECPEGHMHSDGDKTAQLKASQDNAYFTFKCHHNHGGEDHDTRWLNQWLIRSLPKDYLEKFKKKLVRKKENLARDFCGEVINLETRYLADREMPQVLASLEGGGDSIVTPLKIKPKFGIGDARTLFLRSPKGTGKTDVINELVKGYRSVICITHRVSLAGELCARVGLDNYQDSISSNRLGICMNSLGKLESANGVKVYDVVFIDESEQALSHLTGSTLKRNRLAVLSVLRYLISEAKLVICADADLSLQLTVKNILSMRGSEGAVFVDNRFKMGGKYYFYRHKMDIITALFGDAICNPDKRYWIATNAKAGTAVPLHEMAKEARISSILVTADTVKSDQVRAFLEAPAKYIRDNNIRLVIASPTISTGFNLDDAGLIHRVYGIFGANSFTAQDCDQAMHRVRHVESRHIFVKQKKPYDIEKVGNEARSKHEELMKLSRNSFRNYQDKAHLARLAEFERDHGELVYDVALHEARYQFAREAYLRQYYKEMGADVYIFDSALHDEAVIKEMTHILRLSAERCVEEEVMKILHAEVIDQEMYDKIVASRSSSEWQRCAGKKFILAQSLGKSPAKITEADVRGGEKSAQRYRNIKSVIDDQLKLSEKDRKELVDGILVLDRKHLQGKSYIIVALMAEAGTSVSEIIESCKKHVAAKEKFDKAASGLANTSNKFKCARKEFNEEVGRLSVNVNAGHVDAVVSVANRHRILINALLETSFKFPESGDVTPQTKGKIIAAVFSRIAVSLKAVPGNGYKVDLDKTSKVLERYGLLS